MDEVTQYEISKETRLETETQLKERLNQFTKDLGVKFDSDVKVSSAAASHLSKDNDQFAQISDFVKSMSKEIKQKVESGEQVTLSRQAKQERISAIEDASQRAYAKL